MQRQARPTASTPRPTASTPKPTFSKPRPAPAPAAARLAEVDEIELAIEKLVAGGDGLGRWEGIPIFVPRAAPGDRLRVRLVERRPDYGRGEVLAILTPGPGRREPPCPHFARCGGCDLQHLDDELQPRLKAAAARETIERLAGLELPAPTLVTGAAWGYRLRTQLHLGTTPRGLAVGYLARRSHELVPIERCPVLAPDLEARAVLLPRFLGPAAPRRLDLAIGGDGALSVAPRQEGLPSGEVVLEVGGLAYGYDARTFFQAHRGLAAKLVETTVGPWTGERVFDLYAGVGLFSLALAARYASVVAVEGDRVAARQARLNARRNRLASVEVVDQAVETWVGGLPADAERVVVDPPRSGLLRTVREALLRQPAARLTYVSCHPATLARDLRELKSRYDVESVTFLDLFPQTGHLEAVVQLTRRDEPAAGASR